MVDLATLAIAVDSRPAVKAAGDLAQLASASGKAAAAVGTVTQAAQSATTATTGMAQAAAAASTATASLQNGVTRIARAANDVGTVTRLTRNEMVNLSRQMQDIATMSLMGASPFQIISSQGFQVLDVLSSSQGGVRGALSDLKNRLGALITPASVVGTALVAAGAVATTAWMAFSSQQKELDAALTGLGQRAGTTRAGLSAIGDSIAEISNVSRSAGRDLAGLFAGSGITSSNIRQAGSLTRPLSLQLGLDLNEAGELLAKSLDSPSKGADELNKKLGFLDDKTREYIRTLEAQGKTAEAQKVLMDAMGPALADAEKKTTALGRAWNYVWNMASGAATAIGGAVDKIVRGPSTTEDFIEELRKRRSGGSAIVSPSDPSNIDRPVPPGGPIIDSQRLRERQRQIENAQRAGVDPNLAQKLDEEMLVMLELGQAHEEYAARMKGVAAEARKASLALGDIVRDVLPDLGRLKSIQDRREALEGARNDPEKMKNLGVTTDQYFEALNRLNVQEQANRDTVLKRLQDGQMEIEQINARTFAEKTEIAQRRAAVEVLRQSGSLLEAAAAAENERNRMIAENNRQMKDQTRDLEKQVALLGLRPMDRAMKEIQLDRQRANQEQANPANNLADKLRSAHTDLLSKLSANQTEFLNKLLAALTGGKAVPLTPQEGVGNQFDNLMPGMSGGMKGTISGTLAAAAQAIKNIESRGSGGYGAIGAVTKSGDRAYGAYGIMGANIGPWSQQYFGQRLTTQEFLSNPAAQDAIFAGRFGEYQKRYGWAGAAQAWFGGPGSVGKMGRADMHGTTVGGYTQKFLAGMGQGGAAPGGTTAPDSNYQTEALAQDALKAKIAGDQIEQIYRDAEKQIESMKRANEDATGAWRRNAFEVDKAANEQRLLNQAYDVTKNVTPEVRQRISELSAEMAKQQQIAREQKQAFEIMKGAIQEIASGMSNFATSFVNGILNGEKAAKSLQSALKGLASQLLNFAINTAINMAFKSMFPQFLGSAHGNVFMGGNVVPFARGGIVSRPTVFPMARGMGLMGEAGPEAVMPLARDNQGRLGVRGGGTVNNFAVYNMGGAKVETEAQENDTGGVDYRVFVDRMTAQGVQGSDTKAALEGQYAMSRRRRVR